MSRMFQRRYHRKQSRRLRLDCGNQSPRSRYAKSTDLRFRLKLTLYQRSSGCMSSNLDLGQPQSRLSTSLLSPALCVEHEGSDSVSRPIAAAAALTGGLLVFKRDGIARKMQIKRNIVWCIRIWRPAGRQHYSLRTKFFRRSLCFEVSSPNADVMLRSRAARGMTSLAMKVASAVRLLECRSSSVVLSSPRCP
jgi:hypothetical protein